MEEISKKWFCVPKGVGGQAYGGDVQQEEVSSNKSKEN